MASKRKFVFDEDDDDGFQEIHVSNKKHTLDSDEEDSDDYERENLQDSDIEGEEDGVAKIQDEVKITPFNMREELEEGHFDKEGQYHWNKNTDIKDNWLDNIDWLKVQDNKNYLNPDKKESSENSEDNLGIYNESKVYTEVIKFMQPNETVQKTLQRLGKNREKLSSAERIKRKKLGIIDENAEKIEKFTELVNQILTKTGNMDIYQESYEYIDSKISKLPSTSVAHNWRKKIDESVDMYADDFTEKEKKILLIDSKNKDTSSKFENGKDTSKLLWEFKWKQDDNDLQGPFTTEQMLKWSEEKYFKTGVYVRKVGEKTNFYTSNRIDFELYLS